jgi:hypothetical protein
MSKFRSTHAPENLGRLIKKIGILGYIEAEKKVWLAQ